MARHAPIRALDLERRLGTRFTIDTVKAIKRLFPDDRFIWLLGSDTLPEFHKWRDYRGLARICPIAVLNRPGYDRLARAARAMGWLRRFVRPASQARAMDEVECTGDRLSSPAARPVLRHRRARA